MEDVEIQTEPPDKLNFSGLLTQWVIYDKYIKYEAAKEMSEVDESKNGVPQMRRKFHEKEEEHILETEKRKMKRCGLILERMVNQNVFNDISLGNDSFRGKVLVVFFLLNRFPVL